jgi:hypothetical protein
MFNDGGNVYFAGQSITLPYIYFVRVQHSMYNTKYFLVMETMQSYLLF